MGLEHGRVECLPHTERNIGASGDPFLCTPHAQASGSSEVPSCGSAGFSFCRPSEQPAGGQRRGGRSSANRDIYGFND